jgi:hypothetical protein
MIKNLNNLYKILSDMIDKRINNKKLINVYIVNTVNEENFTVNIKHPNFKNLIYNDVPISSIGLGNFKGLMKLPSEGDNVIVGFINGDENSPIVIGNIFNKTVHGTQQNPIINQDELLINAKSKGSYIILKSNNDILIRTCDNNGNKKGAIKIDSNGVITLNNGSNAIARIGDSVEVNVPTIGTCSGTITSGNTTIRG